MNYVLFTGDDFSNMVITLDMMACVGQLNDPVANGLGGLMCLWQEWHHLQECVAHALQELDSDAIVCGVILIQRVVLSVFALGLSNAACKNHRVVYQWILFAAHHVCLGEVR